MNNMVKNVAIITAGGTGKRLSAEQKKQFIKIGEYTILEWTILPFLNSNTIEKIIITLPREEFNEYASHIAAIFPNHSILCITGGEERQESVFLALQACPADTQFVLIHDGVRPFIETSEMEAMLNLCKNAIIPVSSVKYTLKQVKNGKISKTVPRQFVYEAHTPQIFSYPMILDLHQKAKLIHQQFTDDASILEYFGEEVEAFEMKSFNLKITTQKDLEIATTLILNRR
jgi:2-C-methyl-D-erythritol 4-phosphate cytidylyltransferase